MEPGTSPIPLIIYRVRPEQAYQLGVLAQSVSNIRQLNSYSSQTPDGPNDLNEPSAPPNAQTDQLSQLLKAKPTAALSNDEGIQRSRQERILWLLHPQLQELRPYRGQPALFALCKSHGFYEAYIPHNSSLVAYEWYSAEQLQQWRLEQQLPLQAELLDPWLGSPEQETLLGNLLKHLFFWQGRHILRAKALASLVGESAHSKTGKVGLTTLQRVYQQFYSSAEGRTATSNSAAQTATQHSASRWSYAQATLPLQNKYPGNTQANGNPAQDWLREAQQALSQLQQAGGTSQAGNKEQQSELLAQSLWALFGYWVSSRIRPQGILRKLRTWLQMERQHQNWESERLQAQNSTDSV